MSESVVLAHWALIDSPLGVAGVIAGEGGCVERIVLPCATAGEARMRVAVALQALRTPSPSARRRPEEGTAGMPAAAPLSPETQGIENGPWTREACRQLAEYLHGRRRAFDLPFDPGPVGGFTLDALQAARRIPYGQTRSYWWVAVRAGNPRAVRAVGQAMARNPVPLLVPCHRVVRTDGSLGGFGGGGPEQKRRLLELEARVLASTV